jgi:hypothetical protein
MNADQLRGLAAAIFQLANITLVAALAGPFFADPAWWPRNYAILVGGLFGVAVWIFLWALAVRILGEVGR